MVIKRILGAGTIAVAFAGLTGAHAWAQEPVKVGVIIPLTGGFQSNGRQIEAAIRTFVKEKGDTAGGKKVEFIVRDDARPRERRSTRSRSPRNS